MEKQFERTANLIGMENVEKLENKKIMIIGIGGVGGYTAEALARAGVGNFFLIDDDVVDITNINRQIVALNSTIGMPKVDVMKQRILDINPKCNVYTKRIFLSRDNVCELDLKSYDYVIDAIDNITVKIKLAILAQEQNFKLISAMGTGNKLHPELFEIDDIFNTKICPVTRIMRKLLRRNKVNKLKVLYSREVPIKSLSQRVPASISFCPSIGGLRIAQAVILELLEL